VLTLSTNIHDGRLDGDLEKLPGDLRRILELGLGGVEIGIHGLDAIRCGMLDSKRTAEIFAILRDHPLRLSLHAPDPLDLLTDRDPELHHEVLRACLEFGEAEIGRARSSCCIPADGSRRRNSRMQRRGARTGHWRRR